MSAREQVASQVVRELAAGIEQRIEGWEEKFVDRFSFVFAVNAEEKKAQGEADQLTTRNLNSVGRYVNNPFTVKNALRSALQDMGIDPRLADEDVNAIVKLLNQHVTRGVLTTSGRLGRVGSPPGDVEPMDGTIPANPSSISKAILMGAEPEIAAIAARYLTES